MMPTNVRNKRKPKVHLVFHTHGGNVQYLPKISRKLPKQILVEYPSGLPHQQWFPSKSNVRQTKNGFDESQRKKLLFLERKKVKIFSGEAGTKQEIARLRAQLGRMNTVGSFAMHNLGVYKQHLIERAEFDKMRHELIVRKIKSRMRHGSMVAAYGTAHSLLSRDLQKRKIESERTITPTVFSYVDEIDRKIVRGENPDKISEVDYARAFVTAKFDLNSEELFSAFLGKPYARFNQRDFNKAKLIVRTLISRLSADELSEVIVTDQPLLVLVRNGITPELLRSPKSWDAFLRKHSVFYRAEVAKRKQKINAKRERNKKK